MPNWCTNNLDMFHPDKKVIDDIAELLIDESGTITFDKILPIPNILRRITTGDCVLNNESHKTWIEVHDKGYKIIVKRPLTYAERHAYDSEKYDTASSWCRVHWGTNMIPDPGTRVTRVDDNNLYLSFETAWSPVKPVVAEIRRRFPKVTITGDYEEPLANFAGTF